MRTIIALLAVMGCSGKETPASSAAPSGGSNTTAATSPGRSERGSAAASRPASVTDEMVASTDRLIAGLTVLADDLDAAADCQAATAALRKREKSMQAMKADAATAEEKWSAADADAKRWFDTTYRPRLSTINERVMKRAMACEGNPEFKAAFEEVSSSHQ
jgi:hypothetical protein